MIDRPAASSTRRGSWWPAVLTGAAIVVIAVVVTPWAGTRPGFDPYGWLSWGWRTWHGGLDTNAAPSFKPLPYVFTLLYALAGRAAQLRLWMDTATAVSLAGVAVAGRLAFRLTVSDSGVGRGSGSGTARPWAGWIAAVIAMATLLGLHDEYPYPYLHYVLASYSDPMVVTFVLAAIDCQLAGRPRAAWCMAVLAALGRPEVWPFAALAAIWLWRAHPRARSLIVAGVLVVCALWFGIPALTARSPLVAGDNALGFPGAPTGNRVTGITHRFLQQTPWPLQVAALLAVAAAAWRRETTTLVLAAGVLAWVVVEVLFTLHGWPGLGRYLFEPSAIVAVLGGTFAGRSLAGTLGPAGNTAAWGRGLGARVAGTLAAAALVAGLVSPLVDQGRAERTDILAQHARTTEIERLGRLVARSGGPAQLRHCGEAIISGGDQSLLADRLGENVSAVGYKLRQALRHHNPLIVFSARAPGGSASWAIHGVRQTDPACRQALSGRSG